MALEISIEVLVQQKGRWQLHTQYAESQKDSAIDEAKTLSKIAGTDNVKVLKEIYDTDTGKSTESTLYKSASKNTKIGGGARAGASGDGRSWPPPPSTMRSNSGGDEDRGARGQKDTPKQRPAKAAAKKLGPPRKPSSASSAVAKLLLVTLGSIAVATGATMALTEALPHKTLFGVSMVGNSRDNFLFIVFVGIFLCSSIPLAGSMLSKIDLSGAALSARVAPRRPEKPVENLKPNKELISPEQMKEDGGMEFVEKEEEGDKEEEFETKDELPPELLMEEEKQKVRLMMFLGDALQVVKSEQQKIDGVSKFGINLFLAGATEALIHEHNLSSEAAAAILSDSVQVLGYKKAQADEFAAKADEYLVSAPKHLHMYEAGRNSMNTSLSGDDENGAKGLVKALDDWNKQKDQNNNGGLLTVLFTDIAGSTSMTQELGDAEAQKAVRVHNRIVRQSLTAFGGKEVKHTGDGIMASFSGATNAVESCIHMQRQVEQHNKFDPSLPLHLKIGINAGEPIAEDDDLFGTTVQMAARITDGAKADQIFVSEIVRGICVGKDFKFVNRGGYEMKGLDEPITLFQVIWEEDMTVEEATQRIAAQADPQPEAGKAKQVAPHPASAPPAQAPATAVAPSQLDASTESKVS